MRFVKLMAVLGLAFIASLTFTPMNAAAVEASVTAVTKPLEFISGGHVLAFTARQVVVATGSHALRVEFSGAREVAPVADGAAAENGRAVPLGRVTYVDLWEGIILAYDAPDGGLLRSTYTVAPGGDPGRIRLGYNAPVAVEPGGDLQIAYDTGAMHESAPVAWQQIGGRRVPVSVSFRKMADAEVGFQVGAYDRSRPLTIDPTLTWSTFLGGSSNDYGRGIAVDASGNTYVTGYSNAAWGSPVRAFSGASDAFVAKFDGSGALQWNTFLGGGNDDYGWGIAVDASGNTYVNGDSYAPWGSPVDAFSGGGDAFVAKLDGSGALQWNTFLGGGSGDYGSGMAVDASGNAFVTGRSDATWGSPMHAFSGGERDAFVAKLDGSGVLQWNTFLGGNSNDYGWGIAVDASGNAYVIGESNAAWGSPVRPFSGEYEVFVTKLDGSGALQWNTFLGGSAQDYGSGIAVDASGNSYVTGISYTTWGSPVRPFSGVRDTFVAKLDGNGALQWNTFLGEDDNNPDSGDGGSGIALDAKGNIFISGWSYATWGSPVRAFSGYGDAFVAKLNGSGVLQSNTFLGGSSNDYGWGIAVDASGNAYVTGYSESTWGSPVRAFSDGHDAFVAIISGAWWRDGEGDLGGGWKWLDWFGYYSTASEPWIYHQEHQWLYPYDDGSGGVFFWYNDMQEFVWTEPATYPYLYRFGGSPSWLWYLKDSANPRWFYNYSTGSWEAL